MELVTIKIDGKDVQVPKESAAAIEAALKATTRTDEAGKGGDADLKKKVDELQGQIDTMTAAQRKNDSEEAKKAEAARVDALVKERATLLETARKVLPKAEHTKLDGLDNLGIQSLVLTTLDPELKLDGKSEDYIKGSFAAATKSGETAKGGKERTDAVGEAIVHGLRQGGGEGKPGVKVLKMDEAQALHRRSLGEAWKQPITPALAARG